MNITPEAIEAAAIVMRDGALEKCEGYKPWAEVPEHRRKRWLEEARIVLSAALPHLSHVAEPASSGELHVIQSPDGAEFAVINDKTGMNILSTYNGTPVMRLADAEFLAQTMTTKLDAA